ncbi:MAG: hypothetical protein M1817_002980 [Caeruleum heppii]|nr:MAG: hypothetical protein M1817_002980 [Caeruleum heppii]
MSGPRRNPVSALAAAARGGAIPRTLEYRRGALILAGIAIYGFTAYGTYLHYTYNQAVAHSRHLDIPLDVSDRYDISARSFDQDVGLTERLTGINYLRKQLARKAWGNVLEVSVGTGRNLGFYDVGGKVKGLVLVDKSEEMVEVTKEKFWKLHPKTTVSVSFHAQDASRDMAAPPDGFDTIIQTMGLCSTPAPVELLRNLAQLANVHHGQILLLEHGRSQYQWLNSILDNLAPAHADRHGCWWNRDVGQIVEESGLEVVVAKRYHLGTTWWFELRPRRALEEKDTDTVLSEKKWMRL